MIPALFAALRQRFSDLRRALAPKEPTDHGLNTLEVAVIAVGVLGLALALVAAITSAVESRIEGIQ